MENDIKKIKCPLCESFDTNYFCKKRGFDLYKCKNCKLLFIFPLPKSIELYDSSYFTGAEKGFGYVDYDADKEPMIPTFHKYMDIIGKLGKTSGKLLDIGAATGFFVNIAKGRGFDALGVELSDYAANIGRNKGLNVITGDLKDQKFAPESFDVVTMFDVIEHVPYPKETIAEVSKILKKGGLLIINTPDAESLWAKVLGKNWPLIMPPEHIHYFSEDNISKYLLKDGFKKKLSTKIGKKFTLQYVIKMLHKWIGWSIFQSKLLTASFYSKIYLPINLRDNFFMIFEKKDE